MFIYTWKFSKRKLVLALCAIVLAILAVVLLFSGGEKAQEAVNITASARTADDRVKLVRGLGWDIDEEPLESQTVVIPKDFTDVYKNYAELQTKQGFELEKYAGKEATRYTYRVLNYPGEPENVVCDIIVYRGRVIAGDVQSLRLDGFMQGLDYPKS